MVLRLADGTLFFVGLAITLLANLLILRFRVRAVRVVLTMLGLAGVMMVLISGTPLPASAYAGWLAVAAAALITGNAARACRNLRVAIAALVVAGSATFALAELRHQRLPHLAMPHGATVYVLGDSISAGIGTNEQCWPTVFAERTSLHVVNLARPGATVETAIKQAGGITETNAVVIVEIGGNDLIGGTEPAIFRNQLAGLISSLRQQQHRVLMLELPLLLFQNSFGAAQRSVAAEYGCFLLPKRCFAAVLGKKHGTVDGLHLSQEGHEVMARIIGDVVHPE
jgi:acyl-CoA thioesterase-1